MTSIHNDISPYRFHKKIGGNLVDVKSVVPVGAEAHTFEPTAKTMVDVANANLYVYNGAELKLCRCSSSGLQTSNVKILKAIEGIELIEFAHKHDQEEQEHTEDDHGHDHDVKNAESDSNGEEDPHVWLDPIRAIQMAENIKNALVQLMPEEATQFERNFEALQQQLQALDQKFTEMVAKVPNDTIIVSHAGYGYWTDRYGIKQSV
ncbi:zinc ABC transporter substrate-binding protein [Anaerobacillus sp. HL2]|nr:zinc ABC transporter substrate-binding protein [Anaerobacillus sp. HL2]